MIGVVIVTHSELARDFVQSVETIVGSLDNFRGVSLRPDESVDSMKERISDAVDDVEHGDGVIIFTDMFGGTPSNLSLSYHDEGKVEVVMGVNLPMLIKVASLREEQRSVDEVASFITDYGKRNIQFATEILKREPHATEDGRGPSSSE